MAFRLLWAGGSSIKLIKPFWTTNCISNSVNNQKLNTLKYVVPGIHGSRTTGFFCRYKANDLWNSVVSVSNAGKHRGRGRNAKKFMKNLNKGQVIGVGKINMLWPGLTGPVMRGQSLVKQQRLPDDPHREENLIKSRQSNFVRSRKQHPLERGWTGGRPGGRSLGPPDPVGDETFDNFDSIIIDHKIVNHMTGNMGRKRRYSSFVMTGNKNGLCGFALGASQDGRVALKNAKNRAGTKLIEIPIYNNHTVYHDFVSQFGSTKVFAFQQNEGYGLSCHRAIESACKLIGIKDLRCKVEGYTANPQHVIKAFILGLLRQRTHAELAEEQKLHLVELRQENSNYPKVVASPSVVRKPNEVDSKDIRDLTQYVLGGNIVLEKKKHPPFFINYKSYEIKRRKMERIRNHDLVRLRMYAEHGELRSFLTDKYPEAKPTLLRDKRKAESV